MRKFSAGHVSTIFRTVVLAAWLIAIPAGFAADATNAPSAAPYDYAEPGVLTGTLYALGSDRKQILYTFRRTATRSGSTVNVLRQFFDTNGAVAAVEAVVYESNRFASYEMKEFQAQVSGTARIVSDPENPTRQKLTLSYGSGLMPPKGETAKLQPDTLFDDTLYPFMMAHWDGLMRGDAVKFRFISLEHERSLAFRLVKTGETVQNGRAVEHIRMEAVNIVVSHLVDPLDFVVEKDGAHRILSYTGRTTPRIKKGKVWKYLDAETVFDWP